MLLTCLVIGWGKKIAYCIAFSADGAMDVTHRYCRNPMKYGTERKRCTESALLFILDEIRQMRRRHLSKPDKFRLQGEDMLEMKELRHYYFRTLTSDLAKSYVPSKHMTPSQVADAQKAAEGRDQYQARQTGSPEWIRARGEDGTDRSDRGERRDEPPS